MFIYQPLAGELHNKHALPNIGPTSLLQSDLSSHYSHQTLILLCLIVIYINSPADQLKIILILIPIFPIFFRLLITNEIIYGGQYDRNSRLNIYTVFQCQLQNLEFAFQHSKDLFNNVAGQCVSEVE